MIEGQNGLNWPRWQRLVPLVEALGFAGLYRSDHFTNSRPPDKDSLELWVSLTWLASNTKRLEFGSLATPMSMRHPAQTARMACALDDLSGGRMTLGIGAGWQGREHVKFGFDLLDVPGRMTRYAEALEVVTLLLHSDEPVSYEGRFYRLREAVLLPRPARKGGPPILVGGNGRKRTLPLAARYADEWNGTFQTPESYKELNAHLDALLRQNGRRPEEVRRSLMTGVVFGRDDAEVKRKVEEWGGTPDELRADGVVFGTAAEIVDTLGRLDEAGVQRVMLQWLDLDDLDRLEAFGRAVLPQVVSKP